MPNVEMPTLQVQANLPGADPTTMASSVATVLERQFTSISGIDSMRSQSSTGQTQITLQFDLSRDIDGASVDVQTAIAEAMPLLPAGMPAPPSFKKQNPADQPIFYLTLTSDAISLSQLDDYAETMIAPRISMVNGVSQVQVWRRHQVRRARAAGSGQAGGQEDRHQRSQPGHLELEPEFSHRHDVRAAAGVHA